MTNSLEPNDLSHLTDEQFYALCPQGEHAPGPEPLSPAAQAVMDAVHDKLNMRDFSIAEELAIAAALRAAADQVVPDEGDRWTRDMRGDAWTRWEERKLTRRDLLAIAAELEARHG